MSASPGPPRLPQGRSLRGPLIVLAVLIALALLIAMALTSAWPSRALAAGTRLARQPSGGGLARTSTAAPTAAWAPPGTTAARS